VRRPVIRMSRMSFAVGVMLAMLLSIGAPPAAAQVKMTFDKRPSIQVGNLLTASIRFKSQVDFREFPDEPETPSKPLVDLHRTRLGVEGRFMKAFEYQLEGELGDAAQPWRDVYIQTRPFRELQVRAGQFKIPFSLDQLTSGMDLDFNYRSLAAAFLAPGRDVGVTVFGRVMSETLRYQAGVFKHGGDNVRESERTDAQADRTYAGRVVVRPWNAFDNLFRTFFVGAAFTTGVLPAGPNGVRGKTVPGDAFFQHLFVNGHRRRIGGEFQWRPGPVGLQAEYIQVRDQRFGQGIDNEDLPNAYARGWYVTGTWLLTGEQKRDSVQPARPFLRGGVGAIEIGARLERLAASSDSVSDGSFSSPRAPWVMPRADDVWTGGVNWYWNDYVKLQANAIRERRTEESRVIAGQGDLWSGTFRVQLGF
jgi:phosphate-selective porin OprO and OprP